MSFLQLASKQRFPNTQRTTFTLSRKISSSVQATYEQFPSVKLKFDTYTLYNNLHLTNYLCLICFFGIKIFSSLLVTFRAGCLFRIKPNFFLLWFFKLIPYEHDIRYVDSFQPFWQSPSLLYLEWKCSSWSENLYWLCENVTKILNFAWRQKPSGQLFSFCPYSAHWSFFSMELKRILFNLYLCNTCIIYIVSSIILWWMDCI